MTREEAIAQLKMDRDLCNFNPMTGEEEPMNEDCRKSADALDIAIKALEQEPVLDKIKDEIETEYGQCDICEYFEDYDYEENDISEYRPIGNIADVLQIIDKYKADMRGDKSESDKY